MTRAIVRSSVLIALVTALAGCGSTGPWPGNAKLPYLYAHGNTYVPDAPNTLSWKSPTDDRNDHVDWQQLPCRTHTTATCYERNRRVEVFLGQRV